jgi:DNA-binding beta-propeller fold protein YncE
MKTILKLLFLSFLVIYFTGCKPEERSVSLELINECDPIRFQDRSYYSPGFGTLNIDSNRAYVPCNQYIVGAPLAKNLLVLQDIGASLLLISNDKTEVLYRGKFGLHDLKVNDNIATFLEQGALITYDLSTRSYSKVKVFADRCYQAGVYICKQNGVYLYKTKQTIPAQYPRSVQVVGDKVYVADTFGHRAIVYDTTLGQIVKSYPGYYPVYVQVKNNKLLVVEEHANRVSKYDLNTDVKEKVFNCGFEPYSDINSTVAEIVELEKSGELTMINKRGICYGFLYSPGSAIEQDDGTYLISDTDNHRVIHIDANGVILTEVLNLNDPTRAFFIQ